MPLTSVVADALGVVTISLVSLLILVGFVIISYSFYFRHHVRSQPHTQLGYFNGPWLIRILFIFFAILWGFGEILRLDFLRGDNRLFHALNFKWQETVCKCYIVSNLGFTEPCLFLTLIFLLRASLQKTESGPLTPKWNFTTTVYVLLSSLPLLALQMTVVLVGPKYETDLNINKKGYFFKITYAYPNNNNTRCYYPLLGTIFLGVFTTILTFYLFWIGRRILILVINKGLQKRVYTLVFFVSSFFSLRVGLLGLSVLSKPGGAVFEVVAFLAFLCLWCCAGVGICILVYFPILDSLALKNLQDMEATRRIIGEYNDTLSLISNHTPTLEDFNTNSGRNSIASSNKRGSISFRTMEREQHPGTFVELSLFSPSQHSTPIGSPQIHGWPMLSSS